MQGKDESYLPRIGAFASMIMREQGGRDTQAKLGQI
jgi:hypothetical protein